MRVAIIHDWLETWAGSERVLAELLQIFPGADLFAVVDFLVPEDRARLPCGRIKTSFIQRLPFARRHFRNYLGLMPFAVEQFDLRGYELVISSCHAVSKAVITGPDQLHICVCYSPPRYAWDMQFQYLDRVGSSRGLRSWIVRYALHRFRDADLRSSVRVDRYVAISHYVARRIRKCYRRESDVIYPPVDVSPNLEAATRGNEYVTVSRFVPYKRVDLIVDAFRELPDRVLNVVGDGPEGVEIRRRAPPNVVFHGTLDDAARDREVGKAAAFLFAAEEDFGIAPLEAQGLGVPVIAYGRGGSAETIRGLDSPEPTGVLFDVQDPASMARAIREFEQQRDRITPLACHRNALRFSVQRFRNEIERYVDRARRDFDPSRRLSTVLSGPPAPR